MTGLAAGLASGFDVLEAADRPGGICSSYYVRPGATERLNAMPASRDAYRFEVGGGHWIFGGDPAVLHMLETLGRQRAYRRRSAVFFASTGISVPYPIQNHLRALPHEVVVEALGQMARPEVGGPVRTMKEWLAARFGSALCDLFFFPFNERYTANLYDRIAAQDDYKTPVNLPSIIRGALGQTEPAGYNATFRYPEEGLDALTGRLAARCRVRYGCEVVRIDTHARELVLRDGSSLRYESVLSTLPLNRLIQIADLPVATPADPYTSVLVLNIGAIRGARCPEDHWVYVPDAASGFHRAGFYSNVDQSFVPKPITGARERVSIYVERAFAGGVRPDEPAIRAYAAAVVTELQEWGFIEDVEVMDPTWIDVAYTWRWPDSSWVREATTALAKNGIHTVGRYGRWVFQGIADSIRDGLFVGAAFRNKGE